MSKCLGKPALTFWDAVVDLNRAVKKLKANRYMSLIIAENVSKTYITGEVEIEALKNVGFEI